MPDDNLHSLSLIAQVHDLVHFLSQELLTVDDVLTRVGSLERDPGLPMPLELRSALPGVRTARLARYPDSGLPYVLTMEPELSARPTLAQLKTVLGDYAQMLTHRGRPLEVTFSPAPIGHTWRVVVMAQLESPTNDALDTAAVSSLSFRRDPA
jgi:hypothetical protein